MLAMTRLPLFVLIVSTTLAAAGAPASAGSGEPPGSRTAITVTSPNGGEVWYADQTHDITWTANSHTGLVEIWSVRSDEDFDLIDTVPAAAGSYAWQVPPCTLDSP
jgi:ABC-type glycerol-3-phosphate transport system substrate-binding protein